MNNSIKNDLIGLGFKLGLQIKTAFVNELN